MYAVCDDLIATRRASGAAGDDLIGLLVAARDDGEALTDAEIRDQVLVFLLAGHDTTALALTFALHLLGRHPEQRERVQAEADAVLAGRTPGAEDVERLAYTGMVLKEAMRLYPPAWALGRRCMTGDEIGGHALPPGADVVVSAWVTHRHPEFWEEPARFAPERFTPERERERHRHAYFPFGAGPRACIGQYFSVLEAVIALAVLSRDFEVASLSAEVPLAPRITLHPAGPVPCRVTPRDGFRAAGLAVPTEPDPGARTMTTTDCSSCVIDTAYETVTATSSSQVIADDFVSGSSPDAGIDELCDLLRAPPG